MCCQSEFDSHQCLSSFLSRFSSLIFLGGRGRGRYGVYDGDLGLLTLKKKKL